MVEFSQGKNKTSALLKNPFNICKFIFVWKVNLKRPFFSVKVNRNLQLQITLSPHYAKNVIRNADYGARKLCLFPKSCWTFNVHVVKIIWILYSLFSTKYIAFWYYWSTWFEASIEDIYGMLRESHYKHTTCCATELVFPYNFSFVFGIAQSQIVQVALIFKARLQPRAVLVSQFLLSKLFKA